MVGIEDLGVVRRILAETVLVDLLMRILLGGGGGGRTFRQAREEEGFFVGRPGHARELRAVDDVGAGGAGGGLDHVEGGVLRAADRHAVGDQAAVVGGCELVDLGLRVAGRDTLRVARSRSRPCASRT